MTLTLSVDDIAMPFVTQASRRYTKDRDIGIRDLLLHSSFLSALAGRGRRTLCVYESYAARRLLAQNGISDLDRMSELARGVTRRRKNRVVFQVRLDHVAHGDPTDIYIKMYWGPRRFLPRVPELRSRQFWEPQPLREWNGIKRIADCGLNVPRRLAVFYRGLFSISAAVIVQGLPDSRSLWSIIQPESWAQVDRHDRKILREQVIRCLKIIHSHHLGWRGAAAKHFYLESGESFLGKLWLIDLEGVYRRPRVADHRRDIARLLKSISTSGADEETVSFWRSGLEKCLP